jgi:glyoxylase-like metal-dependent hydrolase (beta-lactamase superfamily II)
VLVAGFPAKELGTNCWVVATGDGAECVIIDPGVGVADDIDGTLAAHRLRPVAVLLTHGHLDHTFSAASVCRGRGIPAYLHPADRAQLTDPAAGLGLPSGTPLFGRSDFVEPGEVRELADGQELELGVRVRCTPGHTPGSVVFEVGDLLFSGDTLFAGSIGRLDLPGGSEAAMSASLRDVILPMDDAVTVHPGHGPSTTIGAERAANPYLQSSPAGRGVS